MLWPRRNRQRRGGGEWQRVTLEGVPSGPAGELDLVELDDLLQRLTARDERSARVVELRFFGGLTIAETAEVLGLASATVERDLKAARAWLAVEMAEG